MLSYYRQQATVHGFMRIFIINLFVSQIKREKIVPGFTELSAQHTRFSYVLDAFLIPKANSVTAILCRILAHLSKA